MNKYEKRFLSRRICAWCEQRLDRDECLVRYGKPCSPAARAEGRRRCLETYKPRLNRRKQKALPVRGGQGARRRLKRREENEMAKDWQFGRNWQMWGPALESNLQKPLNPWDFDRVWIMRDGWREPQEVNPRYIPSWYNGAGLLWTSDPPVQSPPAASAP